MSGTSTKPHLTRPLRILIGVVISGTILVAGIGFAGSYSAVKALAVAKGFGDFAVVFPIGIDVGIVVLLALDLMMTWLRIRFPMLRHVAWVLTAATIAFNGAVAWPDPLGVGMHAVIPLLFVVVVEAARHAVGRLADITADKHMDGVRAIRWLLSPGPTFLLWRRQKLWEIRDYDTVVRLEQDRLTYRDHLKDLCEARIQAALDGKSRRERRTVSKDWKKHLTAEERRIIRNARRGIQIPVEALHIAGIPALVAARPLEAEPVEPTRLDSARPDPTRSMMAIGSARPAEPAPESGTRPDSTDRRRAEESEGAEPHSIRPAFPTDSGTRVGSSHQPDRAEPEAPAEVQRRADSTDFRESGQPVGSDPTDQCPTDSHPTPQVKSESVRSVDYQRQGPLNPTRPTDPTRPDSPTADPTRHGQSDPTDRPDPGTTAEDDDEVADPLPDPIPPALAALLVRAHTELADWPTTDLTEEKIRLQMRIGAKRARFVRDQMKAERKSLISAAAPSSA
ncbi:DUF2637 domain-containing protein [Streptomyces sp. NPDC058861]|uniref:DUF2637 domain-containing protein n=1 Tax=Streptomyces sp. NPDC058861 TaxID=3346653 RepID=UPI00369757D8